MSRANMARGNWLYVVGIAAALVVAVYLSFGREGPTDAAREFMFALGDGDVEALTELTYIDGRSEEEIREQWRFTTEEVAQYYRFIWDIKSTTNPTEDTASVKLGVFRNPQLGGSYEEYFELPMRRIDGEWKVLVGQISRGLYPALPQ